MLKELGNLIHCDRDVETAKDDLVAVTALYEIKMSLLRKMMDRVQEEIKGDSAVQQAVKNLDTLEAAYVDAEIQTKQAIVDYWKEFGFETGKKSVIMEGCRLNIRETTNRQVIDPGVVVQAAIQDGVGDKVVRELRPVFNKGAFNVWVDLRNPPGVEVTKGISATVIVLEEDK